jgi:hypothetical protein
MVAEFAERQNVNLYAYTENGRTIRTAVTFLGQAVADPSVVKQYTADEQKTHFSAGDIAELEFYFARFSPDSAPSSLHDLLRTPATATRVGGNTTVLAGK